MHYFFMELGIVLKNSILTVNFEICEMTYSPLLPPQASA